MTLKVDGMTCGHCQKVVKQALEGIPGIDAAHVDLDSGTATLEGSADVQVLIGAIEDEGYEARLAS